jgi:hypothetical protein
MAIHGAWAHHSFSMFDMTKQTQVSGTVRSLEWTNPHVWLWVDVLDEKGAATPYGFEGTSVGEMTRRSGWNKNAITPGDKVVVKYAPFKDGTKSGGKILTVTLPDGRTLNADPGVHLPPRPGSSVPSQS